MNIDNWKITNSKFILDWTDVEKGMMISYASIIVCVWDMMLICLLRHIAVVFNVPPEHAITQFGMVYMLTAGCIFIVFCLIAAFLGARIRHDASSQATQNYMYFCMMVYVCGNVVVAHMFGEFSLASGVLASGAPIVGWILFDKKGVFFAFTLAFLTLLMSIVLSFMGVIPYAPIVDVTHGVYSNLSYSVALIGVVVPHLFSLLFLAHKSIAHWKRREADASYLAGVDSLTTIPNRRQIIHLIERHVVQAHEKNYATSFILFDLDHFHTINETNGHHVGDLILNHCIQVVQKSLRKNDSFGRIGGDTFVIVLPDTDKALAHSIALDCLDKLRSSRIVLKEGNFSITASFGVHSEHLYPTNAPDMVENALERTKKALYEAKQNGRNQVQISDY